MDVTFDGPLSIPPVAAISGEVAVATSAEHNCAENTSCATSLHPQFGGAAPALPEDVSCGATSAQMAHGCGIDSRASFPAAGRKVTPTDRERWEELREQIQALHTNVQRMTQRQSGSAVQPTPSSQLTDGCTGSAAVTENSMAQLAKLCLNKQARAALAPHGMCAASDRRSFSVGPISASGEATVVPSEKIGAAPWLATSRRLARTSPRERIGAEATPCGGGRSKSRSRCLHG